jgi:hypothetical protein
MRPNSNEYAPYYEGYINRVPDGTILENLKKSIIETKAIFSTIPQSKGDYAYAEGKWTIKELLCHMIDVERVMSYRAFCISRNDKTSLPVFDHDNYVVESNVSSRTIADLMEEFEAIRAITILQFQHFTDEMLVRIGTASSFPVSPRALGFIIIGHEAHHMKILKERYL